MISEQLFHEAQNVIEIYGIDTIAAQFARKVIESYEAQQTSEFGPYPHQLTVDEICNVCNDSLNVCLQNFICNRLSPAVHTEIQEQKKLIEQMYAEGKLVPLSEQEVNELLFNEEADKVLLESVLKPRPVDSFIENLDTNLSMFENIEDLYKLLEYNPFSLWVNLHYILQKYLEEYVYDVARDGSWVYINDVKYLFDENKKLIWTSDD